MRFSIGGGAKPGTFLSEERSNRAGFFNWCRGQTKLFCCWPERGFTTGGGIESGAFLLMEELNPGFLLVEPRSIGGCSQQGCFLFMEPTGYSAERFHR